MQISTTSSITVMSFDRGNVVATNQRTVAGWARQWLKGEFDQSKGGSADEF